MQTKCNIYLQAGKLFLNLFQNIYEPYLIPITQILTIAHCLAALVCTSTNIQNTGLERVYDDARETKMNFALKTVII